MKKEDDYKQISMDEYLSSKPSYAVPQVEIRVKDTATLYSNKEMSGPAAAIDAVQELLMHMDREYMIVVNLNSALNPINYNIVSIGNLNTAVATMPEIFKSAILSNASNIIMVHNHPSGSVKPSKEDIKVTKNALVVGKLLGIHVADHIILGTGPLGGDIYSFRSECTELGLDFSTRALHDGDEEILNHMIDEIQNRDHKAPASIENKKAKRGRKQ